MDISVCPGCHSPSEISMSEVNTVTGEILPPAGDENRMKAE